MTDQFTSMSPSAIKEIIAHIDKSLTVFEKHQGRMNGSEIQVKSMLTALRSQLVEQLARHAGPQGRPDV